ncbi:MAG TPA: glucose-6-phosphate dehydrogenase [Candidatus Saccharimonadales bacterium]|nr:glucose-6-phosphate dehydrogenase [Candidatus Saccharimonadales bacterium]
MPDSSSRAPQLEPSIIVIFGVTGDLSQRYLLPALYHLIKGGLLHEKTEIIGTSRRHIDPEELLNDTTLCPQEEGSICDPHALQKMREHFHMVQLDPSNGEDYARLLKTMNEYEEKEGVCMNRLYYLSIPPQIYGPVIKHMEAEGLNKGCQHGTAESRLLIEKPFGYDSNSARNLIDELARGFREEQTYRIDHYLAKETVQNILTFRFENPIFEALWNHDHISSIEVSASEKIGIEGRAQFYEPLGALRDFIQSHLLQLLAIITMDRPAVLDSQNIHASKQAVLRQVRAVAADQINEDTVRGQYENYRQEVNNPDSHTETFAGIRLSIDSERWQNVPMILWTGKQLAEKKTEVTICFKGHDGEAANYLRMRIQPNEGIELDLLAKKPGFDNELQPAAMDFSYRNNFGSHDHPDAYERVLVDAVRGDRTLFATGEEVMQAWRIVQPVLDAWSRSGHGLNMYKEGSDGTTLAQSILR